MTLALFYPLVVYFPHGWGLYCTANKDSSGVCPVVVGLFKKDGEPLETERARARTLCGATQQPPPRRTVW